MSNTGQPAAESAGIFHSKYKLRNIKNMESLWYQRIAKETENAFLFVFVMRTRKELFEGLIWAPKSICNVKSEHEVDLPAWFVSNKENEEAAMIAKHSDIFGREELLEKMLNNKK